MHYVKLVLPYVIALSRAGVELGGGGFVIQSWANEWTLDSLWSRRGRGLTQPRTRSFAYLLYVHLADSVNEIFIVSPEVVRSEKVLLPQLGQLSSKAQS